MRDTQPMLIKNQVALEMCCNHVHQVKILHAPEVACYACLLVAAAEGQALEYQWHGCKPVHGSA